MFRATGQPASNWTVTYSGLSGASSGEAVNVYISSKQGRKYYLYIYADIDINSKGKTTMGDYDFMDPIKTIEYKR